VPPGTRIKWRLERGFRPTSNTDAAAKTHDIEYWNIASRLKRGLITEAQAKQMVRASDNKLIGTARQYTSSANPVERLHAKLANTGIGVKNLAEDLGLLSEIKFLAPETVDDIEIPEGAGKRKKTKKKKDDRVKKLRKLFKKTKV